MCVCNYDNNTSRPPRDANGSLGPFNVAARPIRIITIIEQLLPSNNETINMLNNTFFRFIFKINVLVLKGNENIIIFIGVINANT